MQLSYFFNFGSSDVRVVLFYFLLSQFDEVGLALVVFGEAVPIAVGAVAGLASEAQETDFLVAAVASRVVSLLGLGLGGNLRHFEVLDFLIDALILLDFPMIGHELLEADGAHVAILGVAEELFALGAEGIRHEVTL